MELKVSVEVKGALLKKILESPESVATGATRAGMVKLVETIEAKSVKEAPVRKGGGGGNLLSKITTWVSPDGKKGIINSGATYSRYVHEGTGLFGPFHQLIRPKTKKALFWPGALHPVKSTKGMRPNPFFERALAQVNPQEAFEEGISGYLRKFA